MFLLYYFPTFLIGILLDEFILILCKAIGQICCVICRYRDCRAAFVPILEVDGEVSW